MHLRIEEAVSTSRDWGTEAKGGQGRRKALNREFSSYLCNQAEKSTGSCAIEKFELLHIWIPHRKEPHILIQVHDDNLLTSTLGWVEYCYESFCTPKFWFLH